MARILGRGGGGGEDGGKKSGKKKKYSSKDFHDLAEKTGFTPKQIKQWYKGFKKDCPTGELTRAQFLDMYSQFFPDGKARLFYEHVFRTFDEDRSGRIDFQEFIQALSITQAGKPEDKLDLAFRLYDIDGNGKIERAEMIEIMKSLCLLISDDKGSGQSLDPDKRTSEIFAKMDADNDGVITRDEFIRGCMADQVLYGMLACGYDASAVAAASRWNTLTKLQPPSKQPTTFHSI